MKLIDMTNSVLVTDKIQSINIGEDLKSILVLMDCGVTNRFNYETKEDCKYNFDGMKKLLKEYLEGGKV